MGKTCESVTVIVANSMEKSVPVGYYLMDVEEPSKDPNENVIRYRQAVAAATIYCNTLNTKMRDVIYEHKQGGLCYNDCILFTPLGSPLTIFNTQIALATMFLVYNKCGFMIEAISLEETLLNFLTSCIYHNLFFTKKLLLQQHFCDILNMR